MCFPMSFSPGGPSFENIQTTVVCWGYLGIMEKIMEITGRFLSTFGPSSAKIIISMPWG